MSLLFKVLARILLLVSLIAAGSPFAIADQEDSDETAAMPNCKDAIRLPNAESQNVEELREEMKNALRNHASWFHRGNQIEGKGKFSEGWIKGDSNGRLFLCDIDLRRLRDFPRLENGLGEIGLERAILIRVNLAGSDLSKYNLRLISGSGVMAGVMRPRP
jgi:hypothetical protein